MKATFATVAGLFAASAIAIPSLHNPQHDRLHRRQGYGGGRQPAVQYTTEVVSNVVTQYVNAQGQPTSAPAANDSPAQGYQGAPQGGQGGQGGKQGQYTTMVTAANGQQVSAEAWNWGQPGGAHGVSWRYSMPAGGGWGGQYPHQQTSAAAPSETAAAPSVSTPAAQYSPPQQSQEAPSQTPAQSSAPAPQPQSSDQGYQPAPSSTPAASPSGSSSASAPVNSGTTSWQNTVVEAHNIHRNNHSVPNIAWSDSLAKAAQMVANKCSFTHDLDTGKDICGFPSYGQNFACTSGQDNIGQDITSEWYNEEGIYELSGSYGQANPNSYGDSETGHFTQLVWKASTHVGCAVAQCPNGVAGTSGMKELTVCDYGPEGNMGGEYAQNVPRPKGLPSTKGAEKPQGYSGS